MKTCRRCAQSKAASEFRLDARYKDGLSSWCSLCFRENNSAWAKANRERLTIKAAAWRAANPEAARETNLRHSRKNARQRAAAHAEWAKVNRGKRNAATAKHKAAKIQATPAWADLEAIKAIYEIAARIQSLSGIRTHVDHIHPLQHDLICGLHCEDNLQIVPGSVNEGKRNRWSIEDAQRQKDLFIGEAA